MRRCIEKGSGVHFAVKIVDVSTEKQSEQEAKRLLNETISEVEILRQLSGHPSISEFFLNSSSLGSHWPFKTFEICRGLQNPLESS